MEKDKRPRLTLGNILEDIWTPLAVIFRTAAAMIGVALLIVLPLSFIVFKILALLTLPLSGIWADIIGFVLFFGALFWFLYLFRNGNSVVSNWIMSGHIQIDVSEEYNRKLRAIWLKAHKGVERTKPKKWIIDLTHPTDMHMLNPVYPVDKYGHSEIAKDPLCFRMLVPVTHKFFGNLPVKGDEISFRWNVTANNDISILHVRIVENITADESNPDIKPVWRELDQTGTEGIVCAKDIKTGKKNKIEGKVILSDKVNEQVQLCFWALPDETKGESVFRKEF